jgi:hypothetical protein
MIGAGHPQAEVNAKKLRKSGDDLFFATDSNLLWAREGESWVNLGHVVPMNPAPWNQQIHPKLDGNPYGDSVRL